MTETNPEVQAQGLFDMFKVLDKELLDKLLAIAKAVKVQQLPDGIVRISVDLKVG